MISFLPVDHWRGEPAGNGPDVSEFLADRFGKPCTLFPAGRAALDLLCAHLHLRREDEVWIATTFDLPNVSSCVTCTIFNHCRPSRVLTDRTRAILVIHEFGVPHRDAAKLAAVANSRHIPLIEDCAHSIDSWHDGKLAGTLGDWTILSFPKVLPVRDGGALIGPIIDYRPTTIQNHNILATAAQVAPHLPYIADYSKRRRRAFRAMAAMARDKRLEPLFDVPDAVAPWMFPLRTSRCEDYLQRARPAAIDCARWHGADVIVLPCHQFLGQAELAAIEAFLASADPGSEPSG